MEHFTGKIAHGYFTRKIRSIEAIDRVKSFALNTEKFMTPTLKSTSMQSKTRDHIPTKYLSHKRQKMLKDYTCTLCNAEHIKHIAVKYKRMFSIYLFHKACCSGYNNLEKNKKRENTYRR